MSQMPGKALYNEIDRYCCDWLSNLMDAGLITAGKIDDRPIQELSPADLIGYERVHFFAGIAGWDIALNMAGWCGPVWTGSCPCQPFSAAGAGKAADDERHLWPSWMALIRQRRPPVVFGEQVDAAIGWGWLDLVCADLEAEKYAIGATILPSCGVGAPHIRNRLWFVGHATVNGGGTFDGQSSASARLQEQAGGSGISSKLANPNTARSGEQWCQELFYGERETQRDYADRRCTHGGLAHADGGNASAEGLQRGGEHGQRAQDGRCMEYTEGEQMGLPRRQSGSTMGHPDSERKASARGLSGRPFTERCRSPWAETEWIECRDDKWRPVESGTFPLVDGLSFRVGSGSPFEGKSRTKMLRAFGNAIVSQVATEFISAYMECRP